MRNARGNTPDHLLYGSTTKSYCKKLIAIIPKIADLSMPPPKVRTAVIYLLNKIHKQPMSIRPIVSTVNSATINLAKFLDIYLQPFMKQLPAYLKDTTQFFNDVTEVPIHSNTWLVMVDMKILYTNIPNDKGILACYEA